MQPRVLSMLKVLRALVRAASGLLSNNRRLQNLRRSLRYIR